jgi:hypothetical protein
LAQLRARAVIIDADAFFINQSEQLGALALRHAVPAISFYREFVAAGGMMSYGGDLIDAFRLMGVYGGRLLKGDVHYASIIHATIPISTTTTAAIRAIIARRRRRSSNSRNSPSKYIHPAANEFARLGSANSNKPLSKGEKMMA